MFDIGFWEIIIIGVVALLVIGPERLPGIARKAGMWLGRGRRFVQTVKADIDRELATEDLRRVLKEQSESSGIHEILEETKQAVEDSRKSVADGRQRLEQAGDELKRAETALNEAATDAPAERKPAAASPTDESK